MGINTKGFIPLPKDKKDVFVIVDAVEFAIRELMKNHRIVKKFESRKKKPVIPNKPWNIRINDTRTRLIGYGDCDTDTYFKLKQVFSRPTTRFCGLPGMLACQFTYAHDPRDLKIFFDCDCDYSDIHDGSKVIFDLGCYGASIEIMTAVLKTVAEKIGATTYYSVNNDGIDKWVKHTTTVVP